MKIEIRKLFLLSFILMFFFSLTNVDSAIKEQKGKKDETQARKYTQVFDQQFNTVSNFSFPVTNYGVLFLDVRLNRGGGFWPRGSLNQYLFGGGIWIAAQKWMDTDSLRTIDGVTDTVKYRKLNKLVELTYNPNSGASWMVPGRIEDGDLVDNTDITKHRSYFSTDFRKNDGAPINAADGPNWPIWDASTDKNDRLKYDRYFGYYIPEVNDRNGGVHKRGPAFISGEDIFTTFKDTDLNYFEGGVSLRKNRGYPMRLQFEQYIYSWGFGDYKDFIFLRYDIINKSRDTLHEVWLAPVMDVDIALSPNTAAGAANDKARYYNEDPSLNLCAQWTLGDRGEAGRGFGYLGFDFLESPAVYECESTIDTVINDTLYTRCLQCLESETIRTLDWSTPDTTDYMDSTYCINFLMFPPEKHRYLRKETRYYPSEQQMGLKTFRRWPIDEDPKEDAQRYEFLSSQIIEEGEGEPGDYRFMMATGPMNLLPGDTIRTVVGMILANAISRDATGKTEDMSELVRKDKFAQEVYDNNFRAPQPPDLTNINGWKPLNHGVIINWDSTAEMSKDIYERGMDFLGLRIYRARRSDLDTIDANTVAGSAQYPSGKGPLSWKQIAQFEIPTPFLKSSRRAGMNPNATNYPFIDSLQIIGPHFVKDAAGQLVRDTFGIKVMRMARGLMPFGPPTFVKKNMKQIINQVYNNNRWTKDTTLNVVIYDVDTSLIAQPWGPYFKSLTKPGDFPLWYDPYDPDHKDNRNLLLDSVLIGTIILDNAFLDYNPLYWRRQSVTVSISDTASFPDTLNRETGVKYLKDTYRLIDVDGVRRLVVDQLVPVNMETAMSDTAHVKRALDSIYTYIQTGKIKIFDYPDFEGDSAVHYNVIAPYMKRITRENTFIDIGDDDLSAEIKFDVNPSKTEKLINDVPYFYKVLAYDEGDFMLPTDRKINSSSEGLPNMVKTYPRAASVGHSPKFKITFVDSSKMGGLYNFKFFAYDNDRVRQLFAGHELELTFEPNWNLGSVGVSKTEGSNTTVRQVPYSLYHSRMTLNDITDDNKLLFQSYTYLEPTSGNVSGLEGLFTENTQSWVIDYEKKIDPFRNISIDMGLINHDTLITRSSMITTGDFKTPNYRYSYGFHREAYGTLGFSFNYTALQRGGVYRGDSASIFPVPAGRTTSPILANSFQVPISYLSDIPGDLNLTYDSSIVYRTQAVDFNQYGQVLFTRDTLGQLTWRPFPLYGGEIEGSFNLGPAEYLIEFKPGGKETLRLRSERLGSAKDFDCDYLTMEVKNVISYKRPNLEGGDSITVSYPLPVEHMTIDTGNGNKYPHLLMLGKNSNDFLGRFNLSSYGWIDGYMIDRTFDFNPKYAVPGDLASTSYFTGQRVSLGTQGRFYLGGKSADGNEVHFINAFLASGVTFVFDLAKNERLNGVTKQWTITTEGKALELIKPEPGDKVLLKTTGGALGFPMPGAKVRVKIEAEEETTTLTDDLMDQIRVVPNPYYITHEGQASPYDAKVYFTKLPKRATINIYTATGDLVTTLEHDEFSSPEKDRVGVEVWNLLSKNRQRVQSQTLVAVITSPDGSQAVKQFSVVVGGFRLVPED